MADPQADESLRQLGITLLAVNPRHERLIDALLTLAGSEQAITKLTPVDLADVVRYIFPEFLGAAKSAGIEVRTHPKPALVENDPVLLEHLARNLIANADRYNLPEQGWITITTGVVDGHAQDGVENSGMRVLSYEIATLFELFRRRPTTERLADVPDASISRGAGLGLSIVRSVAHAHGGDVVAVPREDGGLIVRVRLPALSAMGSVE